MCLNSSGDNQFCHRTFMLVLIGKHKNRITFACSVGSTIKSSKNQDSALRTAHEDMLWVYFLVCSVFVLNEDVLSSIYVLSKT